MKRAATCARLSAVFAAAFVAGTGSAVWASHQWAHWHWQLPLTLNVCNRTDKPYYHAIIDEELAQWSAATVFDLVHKWHSCPIDNGGCHMTDGTGRYVPLVANATDFGQIGWLGLATIKRWDGPACCLSGTCSAAKAAQCHVRCASALLNRTYLDGGSVDCIRLVACQEIGHTLGLDHQYVPGNSCMNDFAACGQYVDFNQHDIDQLAQDQSHCP